MQMWMALFYSAKASVPWVAAMIGLIWGIHFINAALGYRLCYLGIVPRRLLGLPGILFAPFLHGDFNHIFFNSIPLFVLANFILLEGWYPFLFISTSIIVLSGFGTWLFARFAIHVGASSLIVGYWGYLMISAIYGQTALAIIVGLVSFYYFGALLFSIFPSDIRTSWEGHLSGLISGIATYFVANSPILVIYYN